MDKPAKKTTTKASVKSSKKSTPAVKATKEVALKAKAEVKKKAESSPKKATKAPAKLATKPGSTKTVKAEKVVVPKKAVVAKTTKPAPVKSSKKLDATEMLIKIAIKGIQEKKGKDIVTMDLRKIKNSVTDYFIICHGESSTQVNALARSVEEEIYKATGEDPNHKEGFANSEWILLDYFNVVIHIFNKEKRDFFGIERLWADAEVKEIAG